MRNNLLERGNLTVKPAVLVSVQVGMNGVSRHVQDSVPACASHADRLPPLRDHRKLALELRLVVVVDKEDALQEAWVAHLEGRNPARAVNTYARRERRHRQRMLPILN